MAVLAETRRVTKRFGTFRAVDAVDLAVASGEVVGLLGSNGAGKTTLIRLVLGLLRPSGGDVRLFGALPSMSTRRRVGYVPQTLGLYDDMTVLENWSFTSAAFGSERPVLPESIRDSKDELVGNLPLGLQRRVAFAVAFSHEPELLVLDEPTSGVGPLSRARLWQDIRESTEHGTGVLVTTHNMEEAEQCDRLVVMVDGRVAAGGTVADVIGSRTVVQVTCDDWRKAFAVLDEEGLIVQVESGALRVPGSPGQLGEILARHNSRRRSPPCPPTWRRRSSASSGTVSTGEPDGKASGDAGNPARRSWSPHGVPSPSAATRRRRSEASPPRSTSTPPSWFTTSAPKKGSSSPRLKVTIGPSALFSGLDTLEVARGCRADRRRNPAPCWITSGPVTSS